MKFFKANSYDIIRLYINQIGITIFSLVLYTAIGKIDDPGMNISVKIAISCFATLFYFALIYTASWEYGAKDKIRIDSGKMVEDKLKGLKMGFFANVPNFVFAATAAILYSICFISDSAALLSVATVFNIIVRFFTAMYIGILQGVTLALDNASVLYQFLQSLGYIVMSALAACVTYFGYSMGLKDKKIFSSSRKSSKR